MLKLSAENRLMLDLIFDKKIDSINFKQLPSTFDWQKFQKTAANNGLAALLFQKLKGQNNLHFLPESIQYFLQQHYFKGLQMIVQQKHIYQEILKIYGPDFTIVPLKGIFLAEHIYDDPATRLLSDIDILMPKNEGQKLHELLQNQGFKAISEIFESKIIQDAAVDLNQHFAALVKNGFMLEIHHHLNFKNTEFDVDIKDILLRVEEIDGQYFLSNFDHLRYLLVHFIKHFRLGNMQIKNIIDIEYFIQKKIKNESDFVEFLGEKNIIEAYYQIKNVIAFLKGDELASNQYAFGVCEFLNNGNYKAPSHHSLKRLNKINGFFAKSLYILLYVFPSYSFLKGQLGKQNPNVFLSYYFVWWKGLFRKAYLVIKSKIFFVP